MPAGVSAWIPLANLTLGSTAASVTFSSIVGTYRDLVLVVQGSTTSGQNVTVRFNSDSTASNYSVVTMSGDGSSATSKNTTTGWLNYWTNWDSNQSNIVAQFLDYSATDKHKNWLSRNNTTSVGVEAIAGRWANTSAITTLAVLASTNFSSGTSFALYGVSA